jgi:hypothetical protein
MTSALTLKMQNSGITFTIPIADEEQAEFRRLPAKVRDDIRRYLAAFKRISEAGSVAAGCKAQAFTLSAYRGFSYDRLRTLYYAYIRTGDWRVVKNNSKAKTSQNSDNTNLPEEFIEYWKGQCQGNQKACRPAYRQLKRDWKAGVMIPGYGTWMEWFQAEHPYVPLPLECPPDLPAGWSEANLYRLIPTPAELELSRRGIAAARQHLPDVLLTRVGLRPLEFVAFDDVRLDLKIVVPGFDHPVDLHLLVAVDVASGMILRYGLRPAVWRDDGKRDSLKLRDMKCLIAGLLTQYGYPKDWIMTLIVENATAAVREATAMALAEISCDHIDVSRTMMIDGTALLGGYKDLIEVSFRLMHSELGSAPGQMGRRFDEGPAELAGRISEAKALLTSTALTPHQRAALKLPFLNYDQARLVLTNRFNQMNQRDDHMMEGFDYVGEWRRNVNDQWRPEVEVIEMSDAERNSLLWRKRIERPWERWCRLLALAGGPECLQKIHPSVMPSLYDNEQKLVTVTDGEIIIRIDREHYHYRISRVTEALEPLKEGAQYLAYYNVQEMDMIHLTDGKGRYMGSIPRTRGVVRGSVASKEDIERRQHELKALRERVSKRMPEVTEQRMADLEHNIEVFKDAEAIDLTTVDGVQAVPPVAASITAATSAEKRDKANFKRVDTVKEQLKKQPDSTTSEDWV